MFIRYLYLPAICLLIITCSSSKTTYVDPEYRSKIKNTSLLIVPLENYPELSKRSGKTNHIREMENITLNEMWGPIFSSMTTAEVYVVDSTFSLDEIPFRERNLPAGNLNFTIPVPDMDQSITFENKTPEFILFINNYSFNNETITTSFNQQEGDALLSYNLSFQIFYFIWDNLTHRIAAQGRVTRKVNYKQETTDQDYIRLLESVAGAIVENSPLYSREKAIQEFINNQKVPSIHN